MDILRAPDPPAAQSGSQSGRKGKLLLSDVKTSKKVGLVPYPVRAAARYG